MDPVTGSALTREMARREAIRVMRRDFARPLQLGAPIPVGAIERLADAVDDYRLASEDDVEAQRRAAAGRDDAS